MKDGKVSLAYLLKNSSWSNLLKTPFFLKFKSGGWIVPKSFLKVFPATSMPQAFVQSYPVFLITVPFPLHYSDTVAGTVCPWVDVSNWTSAPKSLKS